LSKFKKERPLSKSLVRKYPLPLVITTVMAIMPIVSSTFLTAWAIGYESQWASLSMGSWVLITLALAITSALALTPPTFMALVYGYFLGWIGFPLLIALNLGAIGLVYGVGKRVLPPGFLGHLQVAYPAASRVLERFYDNPIRLIFFTKLSPILPFAITNLLFTLAGARLHQMLIGGGLGMIPRTALTLWLGYEAKEIRYLLEHPNEGIGVKLFIVALVIFSTLGIGWFFRGKK
jgi:uncharacterized membrane protein YdjX (TVP38/TMEM64 family)